MRRRRTVHAAVRCNEKDAVARYRISARRLSGFFQPSIDRLISMFAPQEEAKVRSALVEEDKAEGPGNVHRAVQMSSRRGHKKA